MFTQAEADAIVEDCNAPKGILWAESETARFEPPEDLPYDVSVCLLDGIKASGAIKIGFVGNAKGPPAQPLTPEVAAEIERICDLPSGALSGRAAIADAKQTIPCALAEAAKRNVTTGFISNPVDPDAQTH